MLHEFAVDPEALSNWQDFRYLAEKFGVDQGRLISRFPKDWKRRVYDACSDCADVEKKRIEVGLKSIDSRLIANGRPFGTHPAWLVNAEAEHAREPFRAIIGRENPRSLAHVLVAAELDETRDLWGTRREIKVERRAGPLASCLKLLFRASRAVLFVDPHFKPEAERFRRPLVEFLRIASETGSRIERIEYHLKAACSSEYFAEECRRSLLRRIPSGCEITFVRWEQRSPGEAFHARYVLTNVGGLRFEHGLDEGGPGETTDVGILGHELYLERWRDYQWMATAGGEPTYAFRDRIRMIGGRDVVLLVNSEENWGIDR